MSPPRPARARAAPAAFAALIACVRGASALEFALILPALLGLLLAMVHVGLYLGLVHSVEEMASDAARYAMVGLDAPERRLLVERWVRAQAGRYALVRPDRLAATPEEADGVLAVTLSYDTSYLPPVPLVGAAIGLPTVFRRTAAQAIPQ